MKKLILLVLILVSCNTNNRIVREISDTIINSPSSIDTICNSVNCKMFKPQHYSWFVTFIKKNQPFTFKHMTETKVNDRNTGKIIIFNEFAYSTQNDSISVVVKFVKDEEWFILGFSVENIEGVEVIPY